MLAKLISSTISKAAIAKFLGFPQSTRISKETLIEKLLALLEVNPEAKAQFEEVFKSELAVGPGEFETLLQCTSLERKRWVHEGKIPVLEYRSFRKAGQDGLFRFGRQLFIEEKITHREQDVLAHFEQALAEAKRIYSVERVPETVEMSTRVPTP